MGASYMDKHPFGTAGYPAPLKEYIHKSFPDVEMRATPGGAEWRKLSINING